MAEMLGKGWTHIFHFGGQRIGDKNPFAEEQLSLLSGR